MSLLTYICKLTIDLLAVRKKYLVHYKKHLRNVFNF